MKHSEEQKKRPTDYYAKVQSEIKQTEKDK